MSSIQLRLLFGAQCRPVGGPAGFEPQWHSTATYPHTRSRAGTRHIRATSRSASSISSGVALAHCSCFWNLWLDRRGRPFNPTKIVGPTALAARSTVHVLGAGPQRPVGCHSTLAWADGSLPPRPQDQRPCCSCERWRGRNRGLDLVARVTPPGNPVPRAVLRWL